MTKPTERGAARPAAKKSKPASGGQTKRDDARTGAVQTGQKKRGHLITAEELAKLRDSLREAQETLDAIRCGEVDAVVVNGANGNQIYSLTGAEQPYRIYVERMQEGAVTVSSEGMILYCKRRFASMLGVPLERVISADLRDYLPAGVWTALSAALAADAPGVEHEASLLRPANEPLSVKFAASRLPMEGQELICLVVTDLTQQKQHEQMRLAKELAEKASASKDSFLAALSHELRTPLNPALMAAVALEKDPSLPMSARGELAMIRRNVELEARLIDDLLDLTRIAQGKFELHAARMELHAAILRALEICRADIEAKQQRLVLHLDAASTQMTGDVVRIQQVMWNLIRNAAKFTPAGGTISIRTGNREPERIWVEVADNGIGFTPETQPKMFLAFEQGGRHITRQFGGLGLGLAISRSIIEAHGGTIVAKSEGTDKGATFTLDLPAARDEMVAMPLPGEHPQMTLVGGGLRILLVEDHGDTRMSMERLLRRAKHEVLAVESARAALALAERERFDIVITDLGLPDQSGLELMRQLRDRHGLKGIATSGYGMEDDIVQSREAGFIHHLTKPISMEKLRQLLTEIRVEKERDDN